MRGLDSDRISIESSLLILIEESEQDRSIEEPRNLRQRVEALDDLDLYRADEQGIGEALHKRARDIRAKLDSASFGLYESVRQNIQRGAGGSALLEWMPDAASLRSGSGYDYLDDLVSGVLRFEEPSAEAAKLESEMVAYQPTPARHIFDLVSRTALTERDVLIDLGSGLGHVTLVASICTNASCTGIELEPAFVDCARKSARSLTLNNARFMRGDVRTADLSEGTAFYLYTPFTGAILRDVLSSLRNEAEKREIRICTFGPCTRVVAQEQWLTAIGRVETDRIAIFISKASAHRGFRAAKARAVREDDAPRS